MTFLATAYYVIVACCMVLFIVFARATRMRLVSYAAFTFAFALIVHMLPGYYIATGQALPLIDRGFDVEVYWIYLTFVLSLPVGLALGHFCASDLRLETKEQESAPLRVWLALAGILVYGLLYFRWLGDIPLNNILMGSRDLLAAVIRRVEITHQLGQIQTLPVLFQYWRVVVQLFALVMFVYFLQYIGRGAVNRAFLIVLFILLTYGFVFTLEKAPYMYAITALFLLRAERPLRIRSALLFLGGGLLAVYFMFVLFMGTSTETWYGPLKDIAERVSLQSASVYAQIEYVRANDFIWLRGIDLQFARRFIDNDYIDLSVWSFSQLSPQYAKMGVIGAAGGNAYAQLYFMFSWVALPIFLTLVTLYGFADRVVANTLRDKSLPARTAAILRSFYVALIPFTAVGFVGSVFALFGAPLLLNSAYILVLMFFAFFIRSLSVRLVRSRLMVAGA
jgi:hypothetical protein